MFAVKHPIMTHLELRYILGHFEAVYWSTNLIDLVLSVVLFVLNLVLIRGWYRALMGIE